jgi:hypothetical protein
VAHPRELISQAVVALLIAANTAAGTRVYAARIDPHRKSHLPALSVYTLTDPSSADISSEMEVGYNLELEIVGWFAHVDAAAALAGANALAEQVEAAMRADEYLGGLASEVIHTGTVAELVEDDGRSDPVMAIAVLTYTARYHTALAVT